MDDEDSLGEEACAEEAQHDDHLGGAFCATSAFVWMTGLYIMLLRNGQINDVKRWLAESRRRGSPVLHAHEIEDMAQRIQEAYVDLPLDVVQKLLVETPNEFRNSMKTAKRYHLGLHVAERLRSHAVAHGRPASPAMLLEWWNTENEATFGPDLEKGLWRGRWSVKNRISKHWQRWRLSHDSRIGHYRVGECLTVQEKREKVALNPHPVGPQIGTN